MFDGSHNFAITFLYAKGFVQANISSDVLPTVNFIQPMQLRALYTVSTSRKTMWPRSPRKTTNIAIMRFISLKNIASLKTELIICVKDSAGIFANEHNFFEKHKLNKIFCSLIFTKECTFPRYK